MPPLHPVASQALKASRRRDRSPLTAPFLTPAAAEARGSGRPEVSLARRDGALSRRVKARLESWAKEGPAQRPLWSRDAVPRNLPGRTPAALA